MVERKRAWQQLLAFLDTLPPEHRETFVLGELEGISRARMGRALGISPNTAYSRLRAARRRFVEAFPSSEHQLAVRHATFVEHEQRKAIREWLDAREKEISSSRA